MLVVQQPLNASFRLSLASDLQVLFVSGLSRSSAARLPTRLKHGWLRITLLLLHHTPCCSPAFAARALQSLQLLYKSYTYAVRFYYPCSTLCCLCALLYMQHVRCSPLPRRLPSAMDLRGSWRKQPLSTTVTRCRLLFQQTSSLMS
jgi:hypothetical protein